MRKAWTAAAMIVVMALPAFAAKKLAGTATLKDSQPVGTPDKKHKQHQSFDLSFDAEAKSYTCRTNPDNSMNATDFVVGETMTYEIDGQKVKIKTAEGKKVDCKVVRVAAVGATAPTPSATPVAPQ